MGQQNLPAASLLGAHMSIEGGLEKALLRGHALGCNTVQIFTKSSNKWKERLLEKTEIRLFLDVKAKTGIDPVISHASYLINLASPDEGLYAKSLDAMVSEINRCENLKISFLVVHPGFHKGRGEEWGIRRVAQALNIIHANTPNAQVKIALENTAGQGTALGTSIEQISDIAERIREDNRIAFCLDTCHMFVAGCDIRTEKNHIDVLKRIDNILGIIRLGVIHLNDSKKEISSRLDRHENIGQGMIGEECFRLIMRDRTFTGIPKILETPDYIENIQMLKSFV